MVARDAARRAEEHPPRDSEHVWVHRESHRAAGRPGDAAEQPEGAGTPEPRVHDRGNRHRSGDMQSVHCASRADERVPRARAQRAKRCAQVAVFPLRVHRRDGQGLRVRGDAPTGGRADGPRPGAQAGSIQLW